MRIIAGTKRGMKLLCPKTQDTRPITDRVKESLFNVLRSRDLLVGQQVADLFCGVGSLGLEALSREAQFVTFVEKDPKIAAFLEKNIAKAGFVGQSRVVRANAFRVGAPAYGKEDKHDLVFVDPPYARTREVSAGSALALLFDVLREQVSEEGIAVVRVERGVALLDSYGAFEVIDRRDWGTMTLALYRVRGHDE
jgi:16S rRNA (guanine(966)-N(2))-methyltransferase RsmD